LAISGILGSSSSVALAVPKASSVAYYDPADTNQDGVVSAAEEIAYTLAHPELATQTSPANASSLTQYNQNGAVSPLTASASGSLNLYA